MKICQKCGYKNEENTAFCQNCGERLENNGNVQEAEIKPQRNNQTLIIIIAIAAAAAVAIAAMFMVSARQNKKANSVKTTTAKTQQAQQQSTPSGTKTPSQSSSAQQSSSASSSQSSQYNANTLSGKQIGVLLMLYWSPDWFKDEVANDSMYYEDATTVEENNSTTYHELTSSGRADDTLFYRTSGDTIIYKYLQDGEIATSSISLQRLVNDYYNNSDKRSEVNGYVGQIRPVSEAGWGTDNF
ncbi:MAG: zinc-ribbon domain-containing protein [Pseudoramibacter sp.]